MKEFFMLLVAMTIMGSAATLVAAHPEFASRDLLRLLGRKLVIKAVLAGGALAWLAPVHKHIRIRA
jgi:hypothetical protein